MAFEFFMFMQDKFEFSDRFFFRSWLEKHALIPDGIWLIIYKKGTFRLTAANVKSISR
ncbi:MAG TPA: hypothetical protein P5050_02010 [Bacteroidia bacterium]|nr:hypothetical protein [Bacteroidia bacterium]HRS57978.1 hypothetical protein [Bacteroidia bacterium]HRU68567.1 hypothetical protein [Bacteroidia bacterium]